MYMCSFKIYMIKEMVVRCLSSFLTDISLQRLTYSAVKNSTFFI